MGRTAALDVSNTSLLNSSTLLEAGVLATAAAAQATESRRHQSNDPNCSQLGWVCAAMVVETYGAWGKEATAQLPPELPLPRAGQSPLFSMRSDNLSDHSCLLQSFT